MKQKVTLPCRLIVCSNSHHVYVFNSEIFSFLLRTNSSLSRGASTKISTTVSDYPYPLPEDTQFDIELDEEFVSDFAKLKLRYE